MWFVRHVSSYCTYSLNQRGPLEKEFRVQTRLTLFRLSVHYLVQSQSHIHTQIQNYKQTQQQQRQRHYQQHILQQFQYDIYIHRQKQLQQQLIHHHKYGYQREQLTQYTKQFIKLVHRLLIHHHKQRKMQIEQIQFEYTLHPFQVKIETQLALFKHIQLQIPMQILQAQINTEFQ